MDEPATEIGALKQQIAVLQERVDLLSRELDRAVALIDRTGEIFGRHLTLVVADQAALSHRIGHPGGSNSPVARG